MFKDLKTQLFASSMAAIVLLLLAVWFITRAIYTPAIIIIVLMCIFLVGVNLWFSRFVSEPIENLTEAARHIAAGSYGVKIEKTSENELGRLTDELNSMSEKVAVAEKSRTEFISQVSHELRTPLTAITGWAETIAFDEAVQGDSLRGINIISKEAERLTGMVSEMLEFTRIQDGRFNLRVELIDIAAELEDAIFTYGELMRQAGKITAAARSIARQAVADGVTTKQIDKHVHDFIVKSGAYPTFLNYCGFPASACISVNEEIIHGIPGKRVIRNGDIVSLDLGATYKGFVGDCAGTYPCGEISEEARKLIEVTRQSFFEGIKFAKEGYRISDIGAAVQDYVESHGYSVVRDYVGHGVGRKLHEAPEVPNYRPDRHSGHRPDPRLVRGMTIAVEPMVNIGGYEVKEMPNGWTVVTADGSLSAHYENTILITDGEPEILTMAEDI